MLVVFDIDGTIADCEHRLHHIKNKPKNWKAFFDEMGKDTVIKPIAQVLLNHVASGDKIVFCTGRPETHREVTRDWLNENIKANVFDKDLYMRPLKDNSPDYVTKLDLLEKIVNDHHGMPDLWYDDRRQVVAVLRTAGVRVLQVADNE